MRVCSHGRVTRARLRQRGLNYMNKKSAQAVAELREQDQRCSIHCWADLGWKATTGNLIGTYTGKESEFYEEYIRWSNFRPGWDEGDAFAARQQLRAQLLIRNVIQHIERRGVYAPPKKRIISALPDWQTISGIVIAIFTGGFYTGVSLTKYEVTKEQLKTEAELDSFKRSIKTVSPIFPSTSKVSSNKPQKQNDKKVDKNVVHDSIR